MRVTVVIPLFNQAGFVLKAVESVLEQTHADWELIVVDDGSTDGGADRLARLADPRIRVVRQENAGVSRARNRGLAEAQAPWVALLDADDTWAPSHLSELIELHERYPHAVLLGSGFWYVDQHGRQLRRSVELVRSSKDCETAILADYCDVTQKHGMLFVTSSVMLNRDVALSLGGFAPGVSAGEDLLMWVSMASKGSVAFTSACSTFYLEPPMTSGRREQVIRRPQEPDVVGSSLRALQNQPGALPGLTQFLAGWHRMRAVLWLELNDRIRSLSELKLAMRCGGPTLKDVFCLLALCLPQGLRARLLAMKRGAR